MSLLVTATLAAALAALLGGILIARGRGTVRPGPVGSSEPAGPASTAPTAPTDPPGGIVGLKAVIRRGDWRRALPSLLVLGGILGIMLFGSLALIFVFDQPRSGWPMCALAVLTVGWAVREYLRG